MKSVFKREFGGYFRSLAGGGFLLAFMLAMGLTTVVFNVLSGYRTLQPSAQYVCLLYIPLVPLFLMNQFAREKRLGVDRLLCASPMRLGGVAVGKYLAALTLLLLACLISCVFPAALTLVAGAPVFANATAMLGLFALGAFLLSAQTLVSALTPNRYLALVCGLMLMVLFRFISNLSGALVGDGIEARLALLALLVAVVLFAYLATRNALVSILIAFAVELPVLIEQFRGGTAVRAAYATALNALSPYARLSGFISGMFDVEALVYYVSATILMVTFASFAVTRAGGGLRRALK